MAAKGLSGLGGREEKAFDQGAWAEGGRGRGLSGDFRMNTDVPQMMTGTN